MRIECDSCKCIYSHDLGSVLDLNYQEIVYAPKYYLCLECSRGVIALIESGKLGHDKNE